MKHKFPETTTARRPISFGPLIDCLLCAALGASLTGCGSAKTQQKNQDFFTSGSREADQRAGQRMAKDEQLSGSGEGAGEKGVKKVEAPSTGGGITPTVATNAALRSETKITLYDRLGGTNAIAAIVDDFMARALQDPRVNWERKDVKRGGFSLLRGKPVTWNATPESIARLKEHMAQFLALATGGPAHYEGREMEPAHASLHIANPEFDAAVGDLKASLDKLQIPNKEQKELLSIIESTRSEIVTER